MPAKLSQPEYLHILLNHLPIVGLAVATLVTAAALALRNRGAVVLGLVLLALLSASAWPVMKTGEGARDRIRPILDDDSKHALRRHMDLAEDWVMVFYTTAGVAVVALLAAWKKPKWMWPPAVLAVLLACASLIAVTAIAEAGGRIRHPEFRPGGAPPPVKEESAPESK